MFQAPGSILRRYGLQGWGVALDHTTYEASGFGSLPALEKAMKIRFGYFAGCEARYCPGFYLRYLNDPKVMALAAKYRQMWLFPSSKGDDRRRFLSPAWSPDAT